MKSRPMKALVIREWHEPAHNTIRHVFLVPKRFDDRKDRKRLTFDTWVASLRARFTEVSFEESDHYTAKDPTGGWGYPANGW